MNRLVRALLVCMILTSTGANAQRDSISLSLLTCEPGRQIYELFGHTALRYQDYDTGTDIVFNYGLFDFNTPHFIWRFTLGQTDYILGGSRYDFFIEEYMSRGSKIYSQELNLTLQEKLRLRDLLFENMKPENRVYRYNVLFNNCSTMALDKIEECVDGTVGYISPLPGLTFRKLLIEKTDVRPWSRFAVNMAMGALTDLPLKYREEAFSPTRLMELTANAFITDTAGTIRQLAMPAQIVVEPEHQVDFGDPLLTPEQAMWILLVITIMISLIGWYLKRQILFYDIILLSAQGVTGLVIATFYFFSEHASVNTNWLVICFNPLPLIFMPFTIRNLRRGRPDLFLIANFIICTAFLLFARIIPQYFEPAALIMLAIFAFRALSSTLQSLFHRGGQKKSGRSKNRHSKSARSKSARSKSRYYKSGYHYKSKQSYNRFSNNSVQNRVEYIRTTASPIFVLLMFLITASVPARAQKLSTEHRPRLVVGIVIDQMDGHRLESMLPVLGDDGLKMMWTRSYNRTNATLDFDTPDRSSAVASIYTGATPFQHGITGNRWMNRRTLMTVSAVDDDNYAGFGTIDPTSPGRLLASNLADQIKLMSGGRSKIVSVAIERDAAVLAAGHEADAVLWLSETDAGWCSTNYYGEMPQWVLAENDSTWRNPEWRALYSPGVYLPVSYENMRLFTHTFRKRDMADYRTTPLANDRVTEMALKAVSTMDLGSDDHPDLLMLTLYGGRFSGMPDNSALSFENQDIYMRLDRNIAELIETVSGKIGLNNVLFFLTSTGYGQPVQPVPQTSRIPNGTVSMERACALLNLYLSAKLGSGNYIETFYKNHIFLNHKFIEEKNLPMHTVIENGIDLLVQVSGIGNVISLRNLMSTVPDAESVRKRNMFHKNCSGDFILEALPGWKIEDERNEVTYYRQPVSGSFPILFYGNGVRAEVNHEPVSAGIIAPTVAYIVGCAAPNASTHPPLRNIKY